MRSALTWPRGGEDAAEESDLGSEEDGDQVRDLVQVEPVDGGGGGRGLVSLVGVGGHGLGLIGGGGGGVPGGGGRSVLAAVSEDGSEEGNSGDVSGHGWSWVVVFMSFSF